MGSIIAVHGIETHSPKTWIAYERDEEPKGHGTRICYPKECLRHASGHTIIIPTATPTMPNMWISWDSEIRFWKCCGEQKTKELGEDHSSSLGRALEVLLLLRWDFRFL